MKSISFALTALLAFGLASCSSIISDKAKASSMKTIALGSLSMEESISPKEDAQQGGLSGFTELASMVTAGSSDAKAQRINQIDYQVVMQRAAQRVQTRLQAKLRFVDTAELKAHPGFQAFAAQVAQAASPVREGGIHAQGLPAISIMSLQCLGGESCTQYQDQLDLAFKNLADGPVDALLLLSLRGGYRGGSMTLGSTGRANLEVEIHQVALLYKDGSLIGSNSTTWVGISKDTVPMVAGGILLNKDTEKALTQAAENAADSLMEQLLSEL